MKPKNTQSHSHPRQRSFYHQSKRLISAILLLIILPYSLNSCSPSHYDVITPDIQAEIDTIWLAAKEDCNRLETDSHETQTPLRETLSKQEFLLRYPNLTPGAGPTEKHYSIPHKIEPIPFIIITGSTPKNIQRHKRYAYCSLVLPPEIAIPFQLTHPDTLPSKVQTGLSNRECPVEDAPILKAPATEVLKIQP